MPLATVKALAAQPQTTERMRLAARAELQRRGRVAKAKASQPLAVYTAAGRLLGTINPDDLVPLLTGDEDEGVD